jgi:predicted signal transduction protein with EAL and GGDEF domain
MVSSGGALAPVPAAWSGALLLLFHPLVFVAVLLLPRGLTTALDRLRLMLDVVVASGAMVALTLILFPEAYGSTVVGPFAPGPGVALFADGMVIAAAITLWQRAAVTEWRDPLAPLALVALTHAAAHLLVAVGDGGAVSRFGHGASVLPFVLLGLAERKAMEARLLEQALLDPLTQLGNRRLLTDRASHALARRHRAPHSVARLLLDLDRFKVVNDTFGHAAGDSLLVAVASRLRGTVRDEDTIVRLGGDAFAVLLGCPLAQGYLG